MMKARGVISTIVGAAMTLAGCSPDEAVGPDQGLGELALHSLPSARVTVQKIRNDQEHEIAIVESTPDTLRDLDPGAYRLIFEEDGYVSLDTLALVQEEQLTSVDVELDKE